MTRTLLAVDEGQLRELDRLAVQARKSRAALMREAIAEYLQRRAADPIDAAFGLWGDRPVDGLAYQESLRREW